MSPTAVPRRRRRRVQASTPHTRVAILGAGAGGLGMAIRLERAGITDYAIYEKSDGVGGTWRSNTYPGAACDVPSHLYSYSFELNPRWSKAFADQPEILAYFEGCADTYGVRDRLHCGTAIVRAQWDEARGRWLLTSDAGETFSAEVVVAALGLFNARAYPDIVGLETFAGTVMHSGDWDHDHDFSGERVAVIGTGASAVQIIPRLQPIVGHLDVYQRSPAWILPRPDTPFSEPEQERFATDVMHARRFRYGIYQFLERGFPIDRADPNAAVLEEGARAHLDDAVADPGLRATLTPDYPIGCKRVLVSSDYYPALQRDNVALITQPIERVIPTGVVTDEGVEHECDSLVLATGYRATEYLHGLDVSGVGGRSLHDEWAEVPAAYLGLTVAGYPNFFVFYGPNTNQGGNSIIVILEAQAHYVTRALRAMDETGATIVEVKRAVMDAYNDELQRAFPATVWAEGCRTYFHSATGRIVTQMPFKSMEYRRRTRYFRTDDYVLRNGAGTPPAETADP